MGEFMKTELEFSDEHRRLVTVKTSLVDPVANVLLDVFGADAKFGETSAEAMRLGVAIAPVAAAAPGSRAIS